MYAKGLKNVFKVIKFNFKIPAYTLANIKSSDRDTKGIPVLTIPQKHTHPSLNLYAEVSRCKLCVFV